MAKGTSACVEAAALENSTAFPHEVPEFLHFSYAFQRQPDRFRIRANPENTPGAPQSSRVDVEGFSGQHRFFDPFLASPLNPNTHTRRQLQAYISQPIELPGVPPTCTSEKDPHRKLDLALARGSIGNDAGGRANAISKKHDSIGCIKVCVIENVERLRPELQIPFLVDAELL